MKAKNIRAIAEEALSEHDGWYRFSDRRKRTNEIHALAKSYLLAEARISQLEGALNEWETDCDAVALQRDDLRSRLDRIHAAAESDADLEDTALRAFLLHETQPGWLHVPDVSGHARTAASIEPEKWESFISRIAAALPESETAPE